MHVVSEQIAIDLYKAFSQIILRDYVLYEYNFVPIISHDLAVIVDVLVASSEVRGQMYQPSRKGYIP